ncbi:MAG: D-arginine dehydrogenase [Paracoccaceae bacterium]|jgi:D-arginine dehydrogenase
MDFDYIIIGGGIAGLSLGAKLAATGRLMLIEREEALGYHASGRSAALYEPNYGPPEIVELSDASSSAFHAMSGILSPRGVMSLATQGQDDVFDAEVQVMKLQEISVLEACKIIPILNPKAVHRVASSNHAWDIDTDLLLQVHTTNLRISGGTIVTKTAVTKITEIDGGWSIHAGQETYTAKLLVNAAGAWADQVAEMAGLRPIGLQPLRRSVARIPAPESLDISQWPMMFGAGETWYAKPDARALIVSPADADLVEPQDAWADDMVLAEGLSRYEAMVTTPVTRMLANWAGLRSFTPDHVPVIGHDLMQPNFFWLAGQGGYGFQTSPAASELAFNLITWQPSNLSRLLIMKLSPGRFL